tara:strand:- start:302 stop:505 length:204 start_codon:yes stop_codon:yes gene_type:complete
MKQFYFKSSPGHPGFFVTESGRFEFPMNKVSIFVVFISISLATSINVSSNYFTIQADIDAIEKTDRL